MNTFVIGIMAVLFASAYIGAVHAQNQSENQSMATVTDKPQTLIANQTTVPAKQTTVTVNQTTKPIYGQSQIEPLQNQTFTPQPGNLSNLENKTMIQATGPATTIIANKTSVPFNQTTIGVGTVADSQSQTSNMSQQPASQQQQQNESQPSSQALTSNQSNSSNQTEPQSQPQSQQNESKGPLQEIRDSLNKMITGGK
ncbi:MAG TPA: hypothetical protein VFG45_06960 [Candidatus Nitrosocosmicus sp.]|nr:hypothetical protein [Candidatus Nitrosocosmicus sp.]